MTGAATLPCGHLDRPAPGCRWCGSVLPRPWTWGGWGLKWRDRRPTLPGLPPRPAPPGPAPAPLSVARIDDGMLAPGAAGARFNASLFRRRGALLLAYRTGWDGARCHVARLDEALAPRDTTPLDLSHPLAPVGQEDPRLFAHAGRLHVAFCGVERAGRRGVRTHQLYARLADDFRPEAVYAPAYDWRAGWEKNWGFFDHGGDLFAVYSIAPHVVLRIDGDRAEEVARSETRFPWAGGHLRGGAPPVRVGDEYVVWFHGAADPPHPMCARGRRRYSVGVYGFEARPPFRVTRMTPGPLLWADPATCPADVWADVAFPCGAVLEGGRWLVSMGVHDRWVDVAGWAAAAVGRATG